ncbi:TPA: hypothetical protein PCJ90_001340 [Klebsiella quasipneumoniae]|nr:hypothetical protein [Klebsiella quasipneumoniae]
MKYLIMIASMMIAVTAMAADFSQADWDKGGKAQDKAGAYIACAFFGDMTSLGQKPDAYIIPTEDVDKFRNAALGQYRMMNKYFQQPLTGDAETINYAEFVAGQEAVLWDKEGMNSKNQEQFNAAARKHYHERNCPMILESIK